MTVLLFAVKSFQQVAVCREGKIVYTRHPLWIFVWVMTKSMYQMPFSTAVSCLVLEAVFFFNMAALGWFACWSAEHCRNVVDCCRQVGNDMLIWYFFNCNNTQHSVHFVCLHLIQSDKVCIFLNADFIFFS